jgi:hypothetical protein
VGRSVHFAAQTQAETAARQMVGCSMAGGGMAVAFISARKHLAAAGKLGESYRLQP